MFGRGTETETEREEQEESARACTGQGRGPSSQVVHVAERAVCTSKGTGGLQTKQA